MCFCRRKPCLVDAFNALQGQALPKSCKTLLDIIMLKSLFNSVKLSANISENITTADI